MIKDQQLVAYYRVSTQQQGVSGLGLDAQQRDVQSWSKYNTIIAEYTDIESGKRSDRPELHRAIEHCQQTGAMLIIAKLDRLSRNVSFITNLMESKVKFVCCDMPEADTFTIHIFAALAQKEAEMTSKRTKAALLSARNRGVQLGNPRMKDKEYAITHTNYMRSCRKPKEPNKTHLFIARQLRDQGKPLHEIATELNNQGFKTTRKCDFSSVQVFRMLKKG